MKTIQQILEGVNYKLIQGDLNQIVTGLAIDSRVIEQGFAFFAQHGTAIDSHKFIENVIQNGAKVIILENVPANLETGITYIQVQKTGDVIGHVAANYYDHPSKKLTLVGVTGTNGKTTVATLLYKLYTQLGHKTGLVSTVNNIIGEQVIPTAHTTPDAISLQSLFAQMVAADCTHAFMEVSSHAVHQGRINGTDFNGGIFTNITHDHLDYHKTFDEYLRVKKSFFDHLPKHAFALTNADDRRGMVMLQNTKALKETYSLKVPATFKGKVFENNLAGLLMDVNNTEVHFRLSGLFNAYNLLAVYGTATLLGADKTTVLTILSNLRSAPGRFDTYQSPKEKVLGIVDYAHTPDALSNVLSTIEQFNNIGQIITVVGCGGDRDKTKRPEMAQVAIKHSAKVILTADNPRTEDPEAILNDMEAGLTMTDQKKVIRISNRREAIKTAINLAKTNDIVLIAGKGHENYQEIQGVKHHFDDTEVLLEMFQLLEK